MGLAVHGHLAVTHRLEQGTLRARRRAVDFVRQYDVAKDRSTIKNEFARLTIVDTAANDIAGQKIRRELQSAKVAAQAFRQCLAHQCLADSGHVLEQNVLARK